MPFHTSTIPKTIIHTSDIVADGPLDLGGNPIQNVEDPTGDQDTDTKAARVAAIAAIPAPQPFVSIAASDTEISIQDTEGSNATTGQYSMARRWVVPGHVIRGSVVRVKITAKSTGAGSYLCWTLLGSDPAVTANRISEVSLTTDYTTYLVDISVIGGVDIIVWTWPAAGTTCYFKDFQRCGTPSPADPVLT